MKVSQVSSTKELERIARKIRFRTIRNSHLTGTPHLGSCLSCTDLLVWLYWNILKLDSRDPNAPARDRFILSKGHAAPVLSKCWLNAVLPMTDLQSYGMTVQFLVSIPFPEHLSGIEAATGSLGGLPMGLGMALAGRFQKSSYNVYVILSDGECNEICLGERPYGGRSNVHLTIFIDYNKWQATGRSNEVLGLAPLAEKWKAFGWIPTEIDGHSFEEMTASRPLR